MEATIIKEEAAAFQKQFFNNINGQSNFLTLFEYLPDVYLFIKNTEGQFVKLNHTNVEQFGFRDEWEVVGKTDFDIFPKELAEKYLRDDRQVLEEGETILNRVEIVPNEDGSVDWFSTNKLPLYDQEGKIIGLCGTMRNLKKASSYLHPYRELAPIIEFISNHYQQKMDIKQLAKMACLSVSQLEKKFKKLFRQSPTSFIINIRVKSACKMLSQSQEPLSVIARKTGFYDQSAFSKQFFQHMGILPKDYRKKYLSPSPAPQL